MYTPTPIIVNTYTPPSECPKCGKEENIISVCKHCGYVYPEEESSGWNTIFFILIVLIGFYILCTLLWWFMSSNENSLIDILKGQIDWLKTLKIK